MDAQALEDAVRAAYRNMVRSGVIPKAIRAGADAYVELCRAGFVGPVSMELTYHGLPVHLDEGADRSAIYLTGDRP